MSQRKEEMLRAVSEEAQRLLLEEPPPTKPKDMKRFYKNIVHKDGCAQLTASCMFCNKSITSTGASRLVDHLLECMLCVPDVKKVCQGMRCKTIGKRQSKEVELQLLMKERDIQEQLMKSQKTEHRQQGIAAGFQSAECMLAEKAVARFFYANGLPFHVAGEGPVNNYFREMCDAIRKTPASWIPPGRKKLSGPLLDSCYEGMQSNIRARDADGTFASKFGYSYTQDGWDSIDHLPLINSAYYCNGVGAIYLRSVDTSGIRKDAEYIASLMISDIYEIGCTNVVTVVTDTCATMEKAWGYVMDEFPWVSCLPCVPHVVSLLMKDIAKIPEVAETIKEESIVVGWFSNHQKPLAILRKKVKEKFHGTCELIKAGATRFATNTLVGQRLLRLKQSLMATITDAEYVAENFKDKADEKEYTNCEVRVREHKGGTARKLVLDEESGCFWDRVDKHVKATIPIYKMLRRHDTTAPSVGKVYHGFFEIGQHISENCSELEYQEKLSEYHLERWGYGGAGHFFCAAYVLDPEFIDHKQFTRVK